ncbi:uncharacterized protein [Triticum aestivum]|uniref:uncharacterized protein n=1 Tax=Triticum aestivum TaxID=4565 RepID=UPI001D0112C0|nr:uncharacterized protein LOC123131462 [Triticum aestivum]
MAQINSTTDHVDLERNSKDLSMAASAGDAQGRAAAAAAALDELIARKKSKAGDAKRKVRMADGDVNFILSLKRVELGGMEYLDSMSHHYTPKRMEEKRRLHQEAVVMCREIDDEIEARQAQIIKDLSDKGYAEADDREDNLADDEEVNELERIHWESLMAASERRMSERRRMRAAAAGKETTPS